MGLGTQERKPLTKKEIDKIFKDHRSIEKKKQIMSKEWYSLRSILGNDWAIFYFLLGGREAGKSYATTEFFVRQWKNRKRPFVWLRLSESSMRKLLQNNAEKLIDPDLRRRYNLDLVTNGSNVYEVIERDPETNKVRKKELMARVLSLATFYNDKGSGLFDKDFLNDPNMYYNICLDEMNREASERNSFDILYNFANQIENLVRSTKDRLRIICIGNTLEEASDLLCAFDYLPETFGRFYLRGKRAVIDYIEPSDVYLERRKGTVADILMPTASTFTNEIKVDSSLVTKQRLTSPKAIISFNKYEKFTLWNDNIIAPYNNESCGLRIAMRPYLDQLFSVEQRDNIVSIFDTRGFQFRNLITFKKFQKQMQLLKPRK